MIGAAFAAVPLTRLLPGDRLRRHAGGGREPPTVSAATVRSASTPTSAACHGTSRRTSRARRCSSARQAGLFQGDQHRRHGVTGRAVYNVTARSRPAPTSRSWNASASTTRRSQPGQTIEFPCRLFRRSEVRRATRTREASTSDPLLYLLPRGRRPAERTAPSGGPWRGRGPEAIVCRHDASSALSRQRLEGRHGPRRRQARLPPGQPEPLAADRLDRGVVLALGLVIGLKGLFGMPKGSWWLLGLGVAGVLWTMVGWWTDVVKEANEGDHTPVVSIGLRYGMILFIASEVMFFVAWFWIFFEMALFHHVRTLSPIDEVRTAWATWPPKGVETVPAFAPAAGQHPDPAALGHHRHLGAPRAAGGRPRGRQDRPGPDHRARAACSPRSRPTSTTTSSPITCSSRPRRPTPASMARPSSWPPASTASTSSSAPSS